MPILKLKDADIYYEVHGSGPPFLFLSETACDGEVWKIYQVPEFSRDHTVITFDYRGMGQSSKPSTKYTMEMFAGDRRGDTRSSEARPSDCLRPFHGRKGRAGSGPETPIKSQKVD